MTLPRSITVAWEAAKVEAKETSVDALSLLGLVGQPLVLGLVAAYLLQDRAGVTDEFVIVGSAMTALWGAALFYASVATFRERQNGNLEILVATPAPILSVLAGKLAADFALSATTLVVGYALLARLVGLHPVIDSIPAWLLCVGLACGSLWATSLVLSSFGLVSPQIIRWSVFFGYPVALLSNFLLPADLLPGWIQPLSYILPTFWAGRALHAVASDGLSGDAGAQLAVLAAFIVLATLLARWSTAILVKRARRDGTLAFQ